jgi:toxin ParE1/3/4
MLRKIEYHPLAKLEIQESARWYDDRMTGLGFEFLLEVKSAESKIQKNPDTWQNYEEGTKRFLLKRFPYAIIYMISEDRIQTIAVAHCKRNPGYWKKRTQTKF